MSIPQYCISFCVLCYAGAGFLATGLVAGSVVVVAKSELFNPALKSKIKYLRKMPHILIYYIT